jgi:hypothetical protein
MKLKHKIFSPLDLYDFFLGLAILEGVLALWFLFKIPSETRNSTLSIIPCNAWG